LTTEKEISDIQLPKKNLYMKDLVSIWIYTKHQISEMWEKDLIWPLKPEFQALFLHLPFLRT
jgi:hypothetical protein